LGGAQLVGSRDWIAISAEKVFQPMTDLSDQPEYRQSTMASLAVPKRLLCLSEVFSTKYADVCWSQTPFALHQPSIEIFKMVPGKGEPKCNMVWRHLHHLKAISQRVEQSQLEHFLADLNHTYEYLQARLDWSRASFTSGGSAIWLNVNTLDHKSISLDDVKLSWHSIEDLVLSSSCDAGPIKAVKPGLARFEKLLTALNCATIAYPTITRPELHICRSVSNSLRQLRNEGKLLDIAYLTEGRRIQAHRVVLATISEKCVRQFSGKWKVEDVIEYDEDCDPDEFLSYHTLSTMINYAYDDDIDWKEMELSDNDDEDAKATKLDLLLDLAKGADYWLIPSLKSQVEDKILMAGKQFINLENVSEVRERAEHAGAMAVEQLCAQFIEKNKAVVQKANQERK
jgi:sacsin